MRVADVQCLFRVRAERGGQWCRRSPIVVAACLVWAVWLPSTAVAGPTCWPPPVTAPVADPFRRPSCRWCPGNRGIEFASAAGDVVRAVAAGVVTFSGPVAGTYYLIVEHADGLRATYGRLDGVALSVGDPVVTGMRVGRAAGPVHFGLRQGEEYLDPAPFLGYWSARPRLIPLDGSPPRPAPEPELRCGEQTANDAEVRSRRGAIAQIREQNWGRTG